MSFSCSNVSSENEKNVVLNLKETELRLGLPGSVSPERKVLTGVCLLGKDLIDENSNGFSQNPLKNFVSGAKRGFADAINGYSKWGLCNKGGSEVNFGKEDDLFSPRGTLQSSLARPSVKKNDSSTPVKIVEEKKNEGGASATASKAQVVGWPPIRSFRKNTIAANSFKNTDFTKQTVSGCLYIKVSMDGAPYLRKIDLKTYCSYAELSSALGKMFSCFTIGQSGDGFFGSEIRLKDFVHGSEYVLTYEDNDGDWMLVGDVPWVMFTNSCKRLSIMKGSDAIGLGMTETAMKHFDSKCSLTRAN